MPVSDLQRELKKKLHFLQDRVSQPRAVTRKTEELHQLRVGLKEWRSALHLLHGVDADFPHDEIQDRNKPLFSAAGELRFWQLQRRFVTRLKTLAPGFSQQYRAHVRSTLAQGRKDFLAAAGATDCPEWGELKHDVQRAANASTPERLRAYFDALQAEMASQQAGLTSRKIAAGRRRPDELHKLRKIHREYTDNRKLVTANLDFDPGPPAGLSEQSGWMHDLLGDWHDLYAASRQLTTDLRSASWADRDGTREGRAVLRRWKKAERAMWDAIMAVLRAEEPGGLPGR